MNNFLDNFINLNDELTATMILVGLTISFIHGLIISNLYLKTIQVFHLIKLFIHFNSFDSNSQFSNDGNINNIALSLGLLGSLSIIRFRTVIRF